MEKPQIDDLRRVETGAVERRAIPGTVECRADEDGAGTIAGYAAVTGKETVIMGWYDFREVIVAGAFKEALGRDDVRALFNHDPNLLLGRSRGAASDTLRLKEDKKGLHYEVDLPDTAAANDVRTLIQRGDVSGSSFAFTVQEEEWDDTEVKSGKLPLRRITKVELFDVSPVTYPAYPQTSVSARSKAQAIGTAHGVAARTAARAAMDQARAWAP